MGYHVADVSDCVDLLSTVLFELKADDKLDFYTMNGEKHESFRSWGPKRFRNFINQRMPLQGPEVKLQIPRVDKMLRHILNDYWTRKAQNGKASPLSIYVLSNGAWEGDARESIRVPLLDFLKDPRHPGRSQSKDSPRVLGLQFIQFGNDPVADRLMDDLDDCEKVLGLPDDIIDSSKWTSDTDIAKIFLGPLDPYFDADHLRKEQALTEHGSQSPRGLNKYSRTNTEATYIRPFPSSRAQTSRWSQLGGKKPQMFDAIPSWVLENPDDVAKKRIETTLDDIPQEVTELGTPSYAPRMQPQTTHDYTSTVVQNPGYVPRIQPQIQDGSLWRVTESLDDLPKEQLQTTHNTRSGTTTLVDAGNFNVEGLCKAFASQLHLSFQRVRIAEHNASHVSSELVYLIDKHVAWHESITGVARCIQDHKR